MRTVHLCIAAVVVMILLLLIPHPVQSQVPEGKIRIGTFDSRCIAIAYGRSPAFMEYMDGLRGELKKAKEEGKAERVKEIEQLGPNSQVIMHQQGFSTGSVGNIMEKIKDKLPAIAQKANVSLILSKWEVFHRDDSVEQIDITDQLATLFNPDAQTLKIIEDIKKMDPVPMVQVSGNPKE